MGAHSKNTGQKYLPVGINAESGTENMGISHEYHSAPRRRTRGGIGGKLRLAGVIVAILLVAYAVTAILEKGTVEEESTPQTGAGGIAQNILAPLPMQGEAASGSGSEGAADSSGTAQAVQLESFGPARQTDGAYTIKAYDASVIRQPTCGQVDLSYFSDAAFLGDSLTQGMQIYSSGLPEASFCAYRGANPSVVVNGTTCKRSDGGTEVPMEVLTARQPPVLYILLGTNVLNRDGDYSSFLTYYRLMLDMISQALPNTQIYVQSITPVRPEVRNSHPGLYKERLCEINNELAAIALEKNCAFLNLWEALADDNGDLKAEYAQPDGIHIKPEGYPAWVEYLATHTVGQQTA